MTYVCFIARMRRKMRLETAEMSVSRMVNTRREEREIVKRVSVREMDVEERNGKR